MGYRWPMGKLKKSVYNEELARLSLELVKLQQWIQREGTRVVLIFEGRDAAGKGGAIQRLTEPWNPRGYRVAALTKPTERERTQWYFQRYIGHLPAAGEITIYDRSWYNRAGVERVMGYASPEEVQEFLRSCPSFERMLARDGIVLLKYWFSVSDEEQERRFRSRAADPTRRWKLSPIDLESRTRWVEYSRAKDEMFAATHIPEARWREVEADQKRRARLNCIADVLAAFPYSDELPEPIELGERPERGDYDRPPRDPSTLVPERY